MQCVKCGQEFPRGSNRSAAISIFVLGDEYIYSYWYCSSCDVYTVEQYHDRFAGPDSVNILPAVSKEVGDRAVALIGSCPRPYDKNCECPSHRAL